jgi:hypothetical protein
MLGGLGVVEVLLIPAGLDRPRVSAVSILLSTGGLGSMVRTALPVACAATCLVVLLVSGCGHRDPLGRLAIAGAVTFQGKPLDQGTIEFTPEGGKGVSGGAMIKEGNFNLPRSQGLPPGTYLVRISSSESSASPAPAFPGEHKEEAKERIPADYNTHSKQTIKVEAGGRNEFNFTIP